MRVPGLWRVSFQFPTYLSLRKSYLLCSEKVMEISKCTQGQLKFQWQINTLAASSLFWALGISLIYLYLQSQRCFWDIFVIFYPTFLSSNKPYNLTNVYKFPTATKSSLLPNTMVLGFLQCLKTPILRVWYLKYMWNTI